jgi:hypothetical protein
MMTMSSWPYSQERLLAMHTGGRGDRRRVACRLTEVAVAERAALIRRSLQQAPGARPHIPVSPHASLASFAAIAPLYLVFRVVPDDPRRHLRLPVRAGRDDSRQDGAR